MWLHGPPLFLDQNLIEKHIFATYYEKAFKRVEQFPLGNHAATNHIIPNSPSVKTILSSAVMLTQNFKKISNLKDQFDENLSIMESLTLTKKDIWTEEYLEIKPMTETFFNQMLDMSENYYYIVGIVARLLEVANWGITKKQTVPQNYGTEIRSSGP